MAYIDIILLALITVFLILRLRSILGEKNDQEKQAPKAREFHKNKKNLDSEDNVIVLDVKSRKKQYNSEEMEKNLLQVCSEEALSGVISLQKKYPGFSVKTFLQNAENAFNMILTAYANEDLSTLKKLLSPHMYKEFQKSLSDRKKAKQSMKFSLVRVEGKILEMDLKKQKATIQVCFASEQVNVVYNNKSIIVEGDPKKVELCEDTWFFEKDMSIKSPIWFLSQTI